MSTRQRQLSLRARFSPCSDLACMLLGIWPPPGHFGDSFVQASSDEDYSLFCHSEMLHNRSNEGFDKFGKDGHELKHILWLENLVTLWGVPTSIMCLRSVKPSPRSIVVSKTAEAAYTAQTLANIDSTPVVTVNEDEGSHLHKFLGSFSTQIEMDSFYYIFHKLPDFLNVNLSASSEPTGVFACHLISNNHLMHKAPTCEAGIRTALWPTCPKILDGYQVVHHVLTRR